MLYDWYSHYCRVRRAYRSLLIDHAAFVYDTQYDHGNNGGQTENTITNGKETDFRDIAGLLWKSCFYKQIAEFRSSLRKHAAHHDSLLETAQSRAGPSSRHNGEDKNHHHQYPQLGGVSNEQREQAQAERVYIARLNQAFLGFLSDSVAFYQKMVAEVRIQPVQQHVFFTCIVFLRILTVFVLTYDVYHDTYNTC